MSSCIRVFYLTVFAALLPLAVVAQPARDPDALYREREKVALAREAAAIWEQRAARDSGDFESWWKLARASYWLGGRGGRDQRKADLERGVAAGERAIALRPNRPEGYFWKAANMGALAESFGLRQGLRYRGAVKEALERVLRLDAAYLNGSADRALGRWYFKVPRLFGGSRSKSEEHLRRSLAYDPDNHASLFFLAETLLAMDRDDEARAALQALVAAPVNPEWAPEDREFKARAQALLAETAPGPGG